MREPGRYYFNSGTWIRLARIPVAALSNALFPIVEQRLRRGSMQALEEKIAGQPLLVTRRTVVRIQADNGTVRGALTEVVGEAPMWDLEDVPETTFPRPKQ
jgi:hypothetical protein